MWPKKSETPELENTPYTSKKEPVAETVTAGDSSPLPVKTNFPTIGDLFAMLGIVLGLQILVTLVLSLLMNFLGQDPETMTPELRGRFLFIVYLCSMLPSLLIVLYYRRRRGARGAVMQFSIKGWNPMLLLWAFVFMVAVGVVYEPLLNLLPASPKVDLGRGVWAFIMVVGLAPVLEELLCRGVVLGSLRARYGVGVAWIVSSLFFGLLHIQPVLVINAFLIGLILGFIYIVTHSLWATILLHALNNLIAYLLLINGHQDAQVVNLIPNRTLYVVVYIVAVVISVISAYKGWQTLVRLKATAKNQPEV